MDTNERGPREVLRDIEGNRERARASTRPFAWLLLMDAALVSAYIGTILTVGLQRRTGNDLLAVIAVAVVVVATSNLLVRGTASRFVSRWTFWTARQLSLGAIVVGLVVLVISAQVGAEFPAWVPPAYAAVAFIVLAVRPFAVILRTVPGQPRDLGWGDVSASRSVRVWTISLAVLFGAMTGCLAVPSAALVLAGVGFLGVLFSPVDPTKGRGMAFMGVGWNESQWMGFLVAAVLMYASATAIALGVQVSWWITVVAGVLVAVAIALPALIGKR